LAYRNAKGFFIGCGIWDVSLYNREDVLIGEGTCQSINSKLVLGVNDPLDDSQVAVHISKMHLEEDIFKEWIYLLQA